MNYQNITLYTHDDVESVLLLNRSSWPTNWVKVDVFNTELIIYVTEHNEKTEQKAGEYLHELFKQYYNFNDNMIHIEITQTDMSISFEEMAQTGERVPFPLFKDYLYVSETEPINAPELNQLPVPVVAFHSYKGGVGRTLSLIAFVREYINLFQNNKKLLIVDGDIEAPGLTWLGREENNYSISYIDILSVVNAKGLNVQVIEEISHLIQSSTLFISADKLEVPQFFLPTYREEKQLLNIYAHPEKIMAGEQNKYIIVDALAQIGKSLGVEAVVVDLRAGISEYSAPFLFDPRVNKYIVSSTSLQSISGTNLILRELYKQKQNDSVIDKILLTMVDKEVFKGAEREKAYHLLMTNKTQDISDDVSDELQQMDKVVELEYNNSLIHLGNMSHICSQLNLSQNTVIPMKQIVKKYFENHYALSSEKYDKNTIEAYRTALYKICDNSITAEGGRVSDMLKTKAVSQLGDFTRSIPKISVLGTKGAGKTYIYMQMLKSQNWRDFLQMLGKKDEQVEEIVVCPVICSEDRNKVRSIINQSREYVCERIPAMDLTLDFLSENSSKIRDAVDAQYKENQWQQFWENLILGQFQDMHSWAELQQYLENQGKKVIFLFDGFENLFMNIEKNECLQSGIRSLCRGIINRLTELNILNVGMIIFLRKDMAELSMGVNFAQFRNQYMQYELNWTQKDALQLALKLAEQAGEETNIPWRGNTVPVEYATRDVIEEELTKLWGTKMGSDSSKQAYSVRWVLASLSDFNGQLQARDIVRFLKYAARDELRGTIYRDRFLMPDDMKRAVKEGSKEKFDEVEKEIHQLKNSFQKLQNIDGRLKQVPLLDEVLEKLSLDDKKALERFGYLKEVDGECYISESIRYALGYNKSRWGGIKLVSLLVEN